MSEEKAVVKLESPQERGALMISADIGALVDLAHKYPRDERACYQKVLGMATIDKDTAQACFYSVPRDGKRVQGPSVRLAEMFFSSWRNLRVATRHVEETHTAVVAEALALDLETNSCFLAQKRRSIVGRAGRYKPDTIQNTSNAAQSIAFRDVVFRVIPKVYVDRVFEAARTVALEGATSLTERRQKVVEHWEKQGVRQSRLLKHLGHRAVEEITIEDIDYLLGVWQAIKQADIDLSVFDDVRNAEPAAQRLDDLCDKIEGLKPDSLAEIAHAIDTGEITAAQWDAILERQGIGPIGDLGEIPEQKRGEIVAAIRKAAEGE